MDINEQENKNTVEVKTENTITDKSIDVSVSMNAMSAGLTITGGNYNPVQIEVIKKLSSDAMVSLLQKIKRSL